LALFSALAFIAVYLFVKPEKDIHHVQKPLEITKESPAEKQKRIDELVASLISKYQEDQRAGGEKTVVTEGSRIPTLVFLNIKALGVNEIEKEYILSKVTESLHFSRRIQVVERAVLDKLLEELKLSSSQLADPTTALRIGRILSAQMMATGSIMRDKNDWQVNLRLIETETTSIKAAITQSVQAKDTEVVAEGFGQNILSKIREIYPLQGTVLSFDKNTVVLDIGAKDGVTVGLKMKVLSKTEGIGAEIGRLEIISIDEDTSNARIVTQSGDFQEGLDVKELL
jgi:hypothetical protein